MSASTSSYILQLITVSPLRPRQINKADEAEVSEEVYGDEDLAKDLVNVLPTVELIHRSLGAVTLLGSSLISTSTPALPRGAAKEI